MGYDSDNADFKDESELDDDDGTLVGITYVERVRKALVDPLCGQNLTCSDLNTASSDISVNTDCTSGHLFPISQLFEASVFDWLKYEIIFAKTLVHTHSAMDGADIHAVVTTSSRPLIGHLMPRRDR